MLLGQDHLEKIFWAALEKYSCHVEFGTELLNFEQHEDRVDVRLTRRGLGGGPSVEEVMGFDFVVGTDGARGSVRKLLGLSFLGETRTIENLVVGDIHINGLDQKVRFISSLFNFICTQPLPSHSIGICGAMPRQPCRVTLFYCMLNRN